MYRQIFKYGLFQPSQCMISINTRSISTFQFAIFKYNNFIRNIHRSPQSQKIVDSHENDHAFSVIRKTYLTQGDNLGNENQEICALADFEATLSQNFVDSSASEIARTFKIVKNFCLRQNIELSDTRFDKLVDGLMDHCENLTELEILDILSCVAKMPPCESINSHNFHDFWSCLDDICCWKMAEWDANTSFAIANAWYELKLGRMCDFIYVLLDRSARRAEKYSKEQLVNFFFYFNVCRKRAIDFEYEYALEKQVKHMDVDEMAVVAMGYFKTKTKIKIPIILEVMAQRVTENCSQIHEISLTAILKILRYSRPAKIIGTLNVMLDQLVKEIPRLSCLGCIHIALIGTGIQIFHPDSVIKVSQKIVSHLDDPEKVRLKDIERILNVLTMFEFDPKTTPDIFQACYEELHKQHRLEEELKYRRSMISALHYLSLRNMYSYELMNKTLDEECIKEYFGPTARTLPAALLSLDCSIDIECPDYQGNKLSPAFRYKGSKWQIEFVPTRKPDKKLSAAEELVVNTIETVQVITGDAKYLHVGHVLPHFPRADVIVCKDKNTGQFIEPPGFQRYTLGDVMFPWKDTSLEWFAIVMLGWFNTVRDTNIPLGLMLMKKRQLEKIGYQPIFVFWHEFMNLDTEGREQYILNKINNHCT